MKSPATAAVLGFFFGPLGLLYVAPLYAAIAFVVYVAMWFSGAAEFVGFMNVPCAIAGYVLANQASDGVVAAKNAPRR